MLTETVAPIRNQDAEDERARDLEAAGLNGLDLALVWLDADQAHLDLFFINALHVGDILSEIAVNPARASEIFVIRGGHRVPAGPGPSEVQVRAVSVGPTALSLSLEVAPIGDYSTYRLELVFDPARIDPLFSGLGFNFRPGCFTNVCRPPARAAKPPPVAPLIDYLAKDYDSFRHTLIAAVMQRVPGWQVTSEADLDQTLIDLFAAAGDELSDFQDRVMAEAYLGSARKRVSIARHARLVDYHIHQGNQASTVAVVQLAAATAPFTLSEELVVLAGHPDAPDEQIYFASRQTPLPAGERTLLDPLCNSFRLHDWSGSRPALPAGATGADIAIDAAGAGRTEAERVRDLINAGRLRRLVVEEKLNPLTGRATGSDPRKRQLLRLEPEAKALLDPLTGTWLVRVRWRASDRLKQGYSFTALCPEGPVERVSLFHGNLLDIAEGRPVTARFSEPGTVLAQDMATVKNRHFQRWQLYGEPRGVLCDLPLAPLAYRATPTGGEVPPRSTLAVEVELPGVGSDRWDEVISLVTSDDSAEQGDHFVVETDEDGKSRLRFGNGINGRLLPRGAVVRCRYQQGGGTSGNVGAGRLAFFQPLAGALAGAITAVWNPFDVTDGRDAEPVESILRAAPEAFRARQLRAVTLNDYARRAEEVEGVARAVARYAWTGSWRTVRLVVDPVGTTTLSPALRWAVASHLEAVRLIGEDIEIRPPKLVPLVIEVSLCLHPDFWVEDVRGVLEAEFSDSYTADGRSGFFHPDLWTFAQPLRRSELAGRLHAVSGVERVIAIKMRRFDAVTPGTPAPETLKAGADEIFLVRNDPDHMERGSITFDIRGGRQ
jgi:hypothetical protein